MRRRGLISGRCYPDKLVFYLGYLLGFGAVEYTVESQYYNMIEVEAVVVKPL